VVVAAVGKDKIGPGAGAADLASDRARGQIIEQRQKLGDLMAVAPRERDGQRDPAGIDQQVVL
jgi:hypothetical protein